MSLLRFLGIREDAAAAASETGTIRQIAARLERLPSETARYLAGFAYVLARVAHADLEFSPDETTEMHRIVREIAVLSEAEAELVVEIAKSQARLLGGTENYVVTREFRAATSREQRGQLLACLYAVAAADGTISGPEATEIVSIAEELGFTRAEANSLRAQYRDQLAEFQSPR